MKNLYKSILLAAWVTVSFSAIAEEVPGIDEEVISQEAVDMVVDFNATANDLSFCIAITADVRAYGSALYFQRHFEQLLADSIIEFNEAGLPLDGAAIKRAFANRVNEIRNLKLTEGQVASALDECNAYQEHLKNAEENK